MKKALILVDIQNDFIPGGSLAVAQGDEVVAVANRMQRLVELVNATQDWHPADHDVIPGVVEGSGARAEAPAARPGPSTTLGMTGAVANRMQPFFELVIATQDWHPADHGSFASNHPGHKPGDVIEFDGLQQILWPDHCVQGSFGAEFHRDLDRSRVARVFHKGSDPRVDSYSAFFDNAHRRSTGLGDFLREENVTDVYLLGLATDYCVKFSALDAIQFGFRTHVIEDGCRGVNLQPGDSQLALDEMRAAGVNITNSAAVSAIAAPVANAAV